MIGISARAALVAAAMMGSAGGIGQVSEIAPRRYTGGSQAGFGNWPHSRKPMKGRPGAKLAKKAAKGTLGISHPR